MRAIAKNALICTTCFGNAYAGDFELKNETDVFEGSRIEGKLIVSRDYDGKAITEKQFPNLETVCGQMNLRGAKYVQVVSLPKLKSMRSAILRRCPDLEIVDLPKLAKFFDSDADGALYLVGLPKLKSVYLPAFKTVGSDWANRSVWLKDCIACVSFELPLLQNIPGELTIENCPALIAVLVPNLHTVLNIIDDDIEFVQGRPGKLTIRNCRALTSVLMPNLHTVQAEFEIANIKDVESVDFSCLKSINGGSYVPEIIISKSKHYAMQQTVDARAFAVALGVNWFDAGSIATSTTRTQRSGILAVDGTILQCIFSFIKPSQPYMNIVSPAIKAAKSAE